MMIVNYPTKSFFMAKHRIQYWREKRGLSQAQLGERSGTSQNAIWKLETDKMELKAHHLPPLARSLGVRPIDILPLEYLDEELRDHQFSEHEAEPYDLDVNTEGKTKNTHNIVEYTVGDNPNRTAWTLNSSALELEGYMKGDILVADMSKKPKPGDVVCAQIYAQGTADTIFRIFMPPFLVAASRKPLHRQPLMVDNSRIKIVATVTEMLRLKSSVAA